MAGQSEAADDLIAELAKLMAQDAQGEQKPRPSAAENMSAQFSSVRIPGDAGRPIAASPTADFLRAVSASAGRETQAASNSPAVADDLIAPKQPSSNNASEPEPFHFDFDFLSGNRPSSERESASTADVLSQRPEPTPKVDATSERELDLHDTIADLISAELAADPAEVAQQASIEPVALAPRSSPGSVSLDSIPRRDAGVDTPRPEQDRFRVPPVFGLGSTAAKSVVPVANTYGASVPVEPKHGFAQPAAPTVNAPTQAADGAVELDPIEEIESLIGRAMRVEFDLPSDEMSPQAPIPAATAPRPAPSPALRSLATPTMPKSDDNGLSAADQTIFAAAQATGAKVGWVNEPDFVDEGAKTDHVAPRQRRGSGARISRAVAGPLVAVTLLLAAGFGLYWVLGLGSREAGPVPLLAADTSPAKETVPVATGDGAAATQSVVFNEMDGVVPSANEQLVSRDQSDVNEVTQVATAATDLSEEGLANRKVRTVKVRPDGTIVSGDDSVAGSTILPVDRPNVPVVPGAETTLPDLLATIDPVQPTVEETAPADTIYPVTPGSTVPAVDLSGKLIAGKSAIIPLVRPTGLTMPDTTQTTTETLSAPVAAAAPLPTIPGATEVPALGNNAPAYVQLASQRSEAEARQSAQNMVTRYGPLFGGANLEVQRVDLGAKGIYYRVRVPANSIEQANTICTNVKAAGGDCFTL